MALFNLFARWSNGLIWSLLQISKFNRFLSEICTKRTCSNILEHIGTCWEPSGKLRIANNLSPRSSHSRRRCRRRFLLGTSIRSLHSKLESQCLTWRLRKNLNGSNLELLNPISLIRSFWPIWCVQVPRHVCTKRALRPG